MDINVEDIAQAYRQLKEREGNQAQGFRLSNVQVVSNKAKLEVIGTPTWIPPSIEHTGTEAPSRMEASAVNAEPGPTVTSTTTMGRKATVTIHQGRCIGVNKMNLPLPGEIGKIKINPSSSEDTVSNPVELQLTSSSGAANVARVTTGVTNYNGSFSAKVLLRGKLDMIGNRPGNPNPSTASIDWQAVIQDLKSMGDSSVEDFKGDPGGYYFIMKGYLEYEVEGRLSQNWTRSGH